MKKNYQVLKKEAREKVINIQYEIAEKNLSWWDIAHLSDYFYKLGKRYGLIKEFKNNGLL